MSRIRKCLDVAVICDRDGGHAPGISPLYYIFALRDTVHIAHLGVAVQFNALDRRVIYSCRLERRNLHNALDGGNDHFLVKGIHNSRAAHLDKGPFSDLLEQFIRLVGRHKQLAVNRVRKISQRELDDGLFISDIAAIVSDDLSPDDNLSDLTDHIRDPDGIRSDLSSEDNIRMRGTLERILPLVLPVSAEAAAASVFPVSAPLP